MTTASTSTTAATTGVTSTSEDDRRYDDFRARIQSRFEASLEVGKGALFTTDATDLFEAYLDALPAGDRQYHTCHACRRFFETYGGLVTIDENGRTRAALWATVDGLVPTEEMGEIDDIPAYYRPAVGALSRLVNSARVTGVFLSSEEVWGTPITHHDRKGTWTHAAVAPPAALVHAHPLKTAGQAMAEKREDYATVARALAEFSPDAVDQALRLLESEALYRSEKVAGPARWLRDLHAARGAVRGRARDNILWRAVALAPAGFCHPRTSMVGTLLEDIAAGMDFAEVSRRFAAKMHPLQYQRPQAAPSAGNIAEAEKVVEKLGIRASLARRFARLEEVAPHATWTPAADRHPVGDGAAAGGVFAHLTPRDRGSLGIVPVVVPPITMTWEKFTRTVLPTAEGIEYYVSPRPDGYTALVTAVDPDAPPILQWDRPDRRNPVSWYTYSRGSSPTQWGLVPGAYRKVTAVVTQPSAWGAEPGAMPHMGDAILFLLEGARDSNAASLCLFPEILKAELRGIRATIEAFSKAGKIAGGDEASACGIRLQKGGDWHAQFRVMTGGVAQEYRLDRWD